MLCHSSNIALHVIFSTSIPHNDTPTKASKVSNFSEACKGLLIALFIYFKNPLPTNCNTWEKDKFFWPAFHEVWPISIPLVDAPTKLPCLIQFNDLFSHSCTLRTFIPTHARVSLMHPRATRTSFTVPMISLLHVSASTWHSKDRCHSKSHIELHIEIQAKVHKATWPFLYWLHVLLYWSIHDAHIQWPMIHTNVCC